MAYDSQAFLDQYISPHESGGNWDATNPGSTATGKYQLIKANWTPGYTQQQFINDHAAQVRAANALAQDNYSALSSRLGRPPTIGEQQYAWHYGEGAVKGGETTGQAYPGQSGRSGSSAAPSGGNSAIAQNTAPAAFSSGNESGQSNQYPAGFTPQQAASAALSGQLGNNGNNTLNQSPLGFVESPSGQAEMAEIGNMNEQAMPAMPVEVSGGGDEEPMMGMQQNGTIGIGAIPAAG